MTIIFSVSQQRITADFIQKDCTFVKSTPDSITVNIDGVIHYFDLKSKLKRPLKPETDIKVEVGYQVKGEGVLWDKYADRDIIIIIIVHEEGDPEIIILEVE